VRTVDDLLQSISLRPLHVLNNMIYTHLMNGGGREIKSEVIEQKGVWVERNRIF